MSQASSAGPQAVRELDQKTLFIWLGKIFYGLLYKELFLPLNRAKKKSGTITNKKLLAEYRTHHLFLQSVRVSLTFKNFFPASILIVETQEPNVPKLAWDFSDDLNSMFIGCRMGRVGLLCMLQDGGAQQLEFRKWEKLTSLKLHPVQFSELMAMVRYKGMLFTRSPKYLTMTAGNGTYSTIQLPLSGFSGEPLFKPWDQRNYAMVLSHMIGLPFDYLFEPPDRVRSWLHKNGKPQKLSLNRYPWNAHHLEFHYRQTTTPNL